MNKFETPLGFALKKNIDNYEINYSQIMEIAQGGPEVGKFSINGKQVSSAFFGGPILYKGEFVFVPIFVRKALITGFQLCRIHLKTLKIKRIGGIKDLIFLDKFDNGRIYFYEDLNKTKLYYYDI